MFFEATIIFLRRPLTNVPPTCFVDHFSAWATKTTSQAYKMTWAKDGKHIFLWPNLFQRAPQFEPPHPTPPHTPPHTPHPNPTPTKIAPSSSWGAASSTRSILNFRDRPWASSRRTDHDGSRREPRPHKRYARSDLGCVAESGSWLNESRNGWFWGCPKN